MRVAAIDNPERRLAARNKDQRRAHALGLCDPVLHLVPEIKRSQRLLRISAGWHRFRLAHGQASVAAEQRGEIGLRIDLDRLRRAVGRRDQHKRIAEEVAARLRPDQLALGGIVHPHHVGGYKNVGGRAGLDLLCQRYRRGVGNAGGRAGLRPPLRGNIVECGLQRRGGEYCDALVLRPRPDIRPGDEERPDDGEDQRAQTRWHCLDLSPIRARGV